MSFESVLRNFQIFGKFPAIFQLLILSLIPLLSKNMHFIISIVLNILRCVLWHGIWSFGERPYGESWRRIYILLFLNGAFYKCQLDHIDWYWCSSQLCTYWFSVYLICQLPMGSRFEVLNYDCRFIYFVLLYCFALHILMFLWLVCSLCVSGENWSLDLLLFPITARVIKTGLSEIIIAPLVLFTKFSNGVSFFILLI